MSTKSSRPDISSQTKEELRSGIQKEEQQQYICQKLGSAIATVPTARAVLSADALMPTKGVPTTRTTLSAVPTKDELRMQIQREREEFIQRRAYEMAASESRAA